MSFDDMARTMPVWMNVSIAIFKDPEANKVNRSGCDLPYSSISHRLVPIAWFQSPSSKENMGADH
jgi:hypothetical protein